jgi:hypothetical protein
MPAAEESQQQMVTRAGCVVALHSRGACSNEVVGGVTASCRPSAYIINNMARHTAVWFPRPRWLRVVLDKLLAGNNMQASLAATQDTNHTGAQALLGKGQNPQNSKMSAAAPHPPVQNAAAPTQFQYADFCMIIVK